MAARQLPEPEPVRRRQQAWDPWWRREHRLRGKAPELLLAALLGLGALRLIQCIAWYDWVQHQPDRQWFNRTVPAAPPAWPLVPAHWPPPDGPPPERPPTAPAAPSGTPL
jgi:hypothetical protein